MQFDALALAATNSNSALKQLAAASTILYVMIKTSLKNLASAKPNGTTHTTLRHAPRKTPPLPLTGKSVSEKKIKLFQSAYKKKWVVGGFCSTYKHGVSAVHNSVDCASKRNEGKPGAKKNLQPIPTLMARARTTAKAGTIGYCDRVGGGIAIMK